MKKICEINQTHYIPNFKCNQTVKENKTKITIYERN